MTKVNEAKKMLDEAYDGAKAETIDEQVQKIDRDTGFGKMRKVCRVVHDIS